MNHNHIEIKYPILLIGRKDEPIECLCPTCKTRIRRGQQSCGCGTKITWDVAEQLLNLKAVS